jgi:hypothetical protein
MLGWGVAQWRGTFKALGFIPTLQKRKKKERKEERERERKIERKKTPSNVLNERSQTQTQGSMHCVVPFI